MWILTNLFADDNDFWAPNRDFHNPLRLSSLKQMSKTTTEVSGSMIIRKAKYVPIKAVSAFLHPDIGGNRLL
jgi:hypothetical protein